MAAVRDSELRLLIVDDDFLFAEMLPKLLRKQIARPPLRIAAARSAEEGMRLARSEPFDVVLCDFDLRSRLTGVDVLGAVRAYGGSPLCILVSGNSPRGPPEAPDGTYDVFLDKPMTLREVVPLVVGVLRERLGIECSPT